MIVDTEAAMRFLRTAYEPDDWIALFLKSYETGQTVQRVGPLSLFLEPRVHAWLRAMNAQRFNVYVSVNAIKPGVRKRTKEAIAAVRHVFVEADQDGSTVVAKAAGRCDLPPPSYLIHSSPNRVHILWRAVGFSTAAVESLQKHLASELGTDPAATPCSQTTRLTGYQNHKRAPAHLVTVQYGHLDSRYAVESFPQSPAQAPSKPPALSTASRRSSLAPIDRARRYVEQFEPAIAGQHGDLHTFKVCCRVVRGFGLTDAEALAAFLIRPAGGSSASMVENCDCPPERRW